MSGVTGAVIGSAVIGGVVQSSSARRAASTQAGAATEASQSTLQATRETNALQYLLYQQQLANVSPFMQIQGAAASALASGLGLPTPVAGATQMYGAQGQPNVSIPQQPPRMTTGAFDPRGSGFQQQQWIAPSPGATAPAGTTGGIDLSGYRQLGGRMGGGYLTPDGQMISSQQFRDLQTQAQAQAAQPQVSGPATGGPLTANIPGIGNVGITNAGASTEQLAAGAASQRPGGLLANFTAADLQSQLNPSYDFILEQGLKSQSAYNAARGITGGQAMRDQTQFAMNTASTFYQQAFQNYLTQQQQNISSLSALAGGGAVSAGNAAAAGAASGIGANTMSGIGAANQFLLGGATARSAGQVAQGNALAGALGNATSGYFLSQFLPRPPAQP